MSAELTDNDVANLEKIAELRGECGRLEREIAARKKLEKGLRSLLVCYRLGSHRNAGSALTNIHEAEEELKAAILSRALETPVPEDAK